MNSESQSTRSRNKPRCLVLGGGGHARVLIDSLCAGGVATPYAVLDSNSSLWGTELLGIPIRGGDGLLPELIREGATCFVVGLGSLGDSQRRRRLFELGVAHKLTPITVCHPSSVCSKWARLGAGTVLFPMSVVNAGAVLGVNVIINTGAIVEHDCAVEDHVHIAVGARLSGAVRVGSGAHIAVGATVREHISIGEGAIVGAGAVVVKDVMPHTVVIGVPARTFKKTKMSNTPIDVIAAGS